MKNGKIIVLNIEGSISEYITKSLEYEGYSVFKENKTNNKINADIYICDESNKNDYNIPKLIISDKNIKNNVDGKTYYIKSPFAFQELIIVIKKILDNNSVSSDEIIIDTLRINTKDKTVHRSNKLITLTKKEFLLLSFLAKNKDKAVPRAELLDHVWGMQIDPFSNTVEAHIFSIRKKIDRGESIKLVHTIPKYGYRVSVEK